MFPIETSTLGVFIPVVGALVVSPGPDTVLILRNALTSGRLAGLVTVFGVQIGLLGHTALAVFGISVIIARTPLLFKMVALAGALYLAWLGFESFRGRGLGRMNTAGRVVAGKRAVRDGILCNLLNPKVIILYLALFPNFIDNTRPDITTQMIALASVLIAVNILWQASMALAANRLRRWLDDEIRIRRLSRGMGIVLIAFAFMMVGDCFA